MATLTPRQSQVLQLLAEGLTRKEIARQLGIRPNTVHNHCRAIYQRLGVRSVVQAIRVGYQSEQRAA